MGNVNPYFTRILCEACGKIRLHLKGQCIVCADIQNRMEAQREAHPEVLGDPDE